MPVSLLLIEGCEDRAQAVVGALVDQWLGWHVEVAPTLWQARSLLACRHFDVVLTAQRLSDGSAFDVIGLLQGQPALILVSDGNEFHAAQAMRYGFSDFIVQDSAGYYLLTLPSQIETVLERSTAAQTRQSAEALLARQHQVLQAISRAQAIFIASQDPHAAFEILLQEMIVLTQSTFGFIGQVELDSNAPPFLRVHVSIDTSPHNSTNQDPRQVNGVHDIVLTNPHCMLATAVAEGTPFICNTTVSDPRASGLPAGYPPLTALLALPVHATVEQQVAMVVLANRSGGYNSTDVHFLQPLLGTLGHLESARRAAIARFNIEEQLTKTSELLAEKTQSLELTLNSVSQGIAYIDAQNKLRVHNRRCLELLDLPPQWPANGPDLKEIAGLKTGDALLADTTTPAEIGIRHTASGRYLEVRGRALESGGSVHTFTDVTDYLAAQEALRQSEARWRSLTQLSSDWYWEQDTDFRFVRVKGGQQIHLGMHDEMHYGLTRWDIPHTGVTEAQWRAHQAQLHAHEVFHDFEVERPSSKGSSVWISVSGEPIFDSAQQFSGYRGVARNITQRKQAEAEIQRLAFYDELTGLPNRRLLLDRLERATAACARSTDHGALLFLDLDNFKDINDTLGHEWGDRLLIQTGLRIKNCVRTNDTVARLGGDEFVVILQGLHATEAKAAIETKTVAQKILFALNQPYDLQGSEIHSTPSIGIALFSGPAQAAHELLKRTDLAMYQAKAQGRNTLCFFDPGMQAAASARSTLEADIRQGLQRSEFLLYYQPVVNAERQMLGAEALVRWKHPQRGMVPPGEFITLAEQTGLILQLGHQVLRAACLQLALWNAEPARAHWTVAVNVSAQEFRHPDFVQQVLTVLKETGANSHLLKIELTESLLLHDVEESIAKMQTLRTLGVGFSLDDFGTGYSSLSYLKRLPLDQLKIDQSFVRDVLTDPNDAAIACTVVALANSLGLDVVAEGVETEGQYEFLLRNGCGRFQGYYFGRPMPAQDLPAH